MPLLQPRSPLARAVMPVIGGALVIAAMGALLWGIASYASSGKVDRSERLAPSEFTIGPVESLAESVAADGPLFFAELGTSVGDRSVVIDHTGEIAADGWRVYWAYPADRDRGCIVEQVRGTRDFVDCDGRRIPVEQLTPPDTGVFPRVEDRRTLILDLRGVSDATD